MGLNLILVFSMVAGLEIKMDTKGLVELRDTIGRYATKLPKAMNTDIKTIAEDYAFEMRNELNAKMLVWRGFLFGSCFVEQIDKDSYAIPIPRYGQYIDKMDGGSEGHFAPLSDPVLMDWVKSGRGKIRGGGGPTKKGFIWVRPHPWMDIAFKRARERLDERLENGEFHKTIKRRGR